MPSNNQDWKTKYFASLDELEQKETEWENMVSQLRHFVSRVSVAGEGVDETLDEKLKALRKDIHAGVKNNAIQQHVDNISNALLKIDEDKADAQGELLHAINELLLPLSDCNLPRALLRKIRKFYKKVNSVVEQVPAELLQEYKDILCDFVELVKTGVITQEQEETRTLWQKLFGIHETNVDKIAPPPHLVAILNRLLTQLSVTDSLEKRACSVRDVLNSDIKVGELPEVLDSISAIVVDAFQGDQQKFDSFIKQINTRLTDVQSFLGQAESRGEGSQQDTHSLYSSIRTEVEDLQTAVGDASGMSSIEEVLQKHLGAITQHMETYKTSQTARYEEAVSETKILRDQLKETENRAGVLQEELQEQRATAKRDTLTKLPNRQAYDEYVIKAYQRWQRKQNNLVLAVADIDFFKKVNDTYGHLAGDKVLAKVGALLAAKIRKSDFVARYGGEEFAIVMEDTNAEDAAQVLETVRKTIQETQFHFRQQRVDVTMSFGLTLLEAGDESPEAAFERSDKALYQAKEQGRNQVVAG